MGAGYHLGYAALPALTLLECGVPPADPVIQKAAMYVRKFAPGYKDGYQTYQISLAVLLLDKIGDPKDHNLIRYLAARPDCGPAIRWRLVV